jgi:hypothetical protein
MCCLFWPALISLADEGIHNTDGFVKEIGESKSTVFVLVKTIE